MERLIMTLIGFSYFQPLHVLSWYIVFCQQVSLCRKLKEKEFIHPLSCDHLMLLTLQRGTTRTTIVRTSSTSILCHLFVIKSLQSTSVFHLLLFNSYSRKFIAALPLLFFCWGTTNYSLASRDQDKWGNNKEDKEMLWRGKRINFNQICCRFRQRLCLLQ